MLNVFLVKVAKFNSREIPKEGFFTKIKKKKKVFSPKKPFPEGIALSSA